LEVGLVDAVEKARGHDAEVAIFAVAEAPAPFQLSHQSGRLLPGLLVLGVLNVNWHRECATLEAGKDP
jgi:hypothetical protein